MEKSRYVRVVDGKEVRRNDPVEYFLPTELGSTSLVPEGVMAIEVSQMKRFLEEKKIEGAKKSVLPSDKEKRIGGIHIKK